MEDRKVFGLLGVGVLLVAALIVLGCMVYPQYRVYSYRMEGEAKLREAESSRQIAVEEAKAKLDSAKMLAEAAEIEAKGKAQAEIARANGTAESIRIVGDSLDKYPVYLPFAFMGNLDNTDTVYVPTELGWPTFLLEANRKGRKSGEQRAEVDKAKAGIAD